MRYALPIKADADGRLPSVEAVAEDERDILVLVKDKGRWTATLMGPSADGLRRKTLPAPWKADIPDMLVRQAAERAFPNVQVVLCRPMPKRRPPRRKRKDARDRAWDRLCRAVQG